MTRLELLELWMDQVSSSRQRLTLVALYQVAPAAVKDAMVAAMKADLVAIYGERVAQATAAASGVQGEADEVGAVV